MKGLRLTFIFLFAAFFCLADSNPLLSLFGKSNDNTEADDKATVSTASDVKSPGDATTTTTTTTPGPSSSCGGLKGFLHICDKNEPAEPPKNIKKRGVSRESFDESGDESKSGDDSEESDSDENPSGKEKKQKTTETSAVVSEPAEGGIAKRQVGDPEAPILGEIPPVIADSVTVPEKPAENPEEDSAKERKRQAEDSDSNDNSDEDEMEDTLQGSRRKRDCRDRGGYYEKNCRKKREFVPSCFEWSCKHKKSTETNE